MFYIFEVLFYNPEVVLIFETFVFIVFLRYLGRLID